MTSDIRARLRRLAPGLVLPVIAAPMFLASGPTLLLAQCRAGLIGSLPALNARSTEQLDAWLTDIETALAEDPAAVSAYAVNLIARPGNERLMPDLDALVRHRTPIVIVSLAAPGAVVEAVHGYGGLVLSDVATPRHARKAVAAGVDGLIAVAAGAGGHTGFVSPIALIEDIRREWDGLLLLSGCIASGRAILAAQTLGADMAYIGSAFLACPEADVPDAYRDMVARGASDDILSTGALCGTPATFLRPSIEAAGLAIKDLSQLKPGTLAEAPSGARPWRDIWSAGQGIGAVDRVQPVAAFVDRLKREYAVARATIPPSMQ